MLEIEQHLQFEFIIDKSSGMRYHKLLILNCFFFQGFFASGQTNELAPLIPLGKKAPPILVKQWFKGSPINRFTKGTVYVIEFWATWCQPCKAAMPHLSEIQKKYKDFVKVIGINIHETSFNKSKAISQFIKSNQKLISYSIALGDSIFMAKEWLEAMGESNTGIPKTFIVDGNGILAWIGHPQNLDVVLSQILNNTWSTADELARREYHNYLRQLDDSLSYEVLQYQEDARYEPIRQGNPDSILSIVGRAISRVPDLTYTPGTVYNIFTALLRLQKFDEAFKYGHAAITTRTYEEPAAFFIADILFEQRNKKFLTQNLYQLGAEAFQTEIDNFIYPELANLALRYHKMAEMYWLGGMKQNAIDAEKKAISKMKNNINYNKEALAQYEQKLREYLQ